MNPIQFLHNAIADGDAIMIITAPSAPAGTEVEISVCTNIHSAQYALWLLTEAGESPAITEDMA